MEEQLTKEEILAGLRDLAEERRTWFREDGDDQEFRRDRHHPASPVIPPGSLPPAGKTCRGLFL